MKKIFLQILSFFFLIYSCNCQEDIIHSDQIEKPYYHDNKYLLAPSCFGLKKGERYYNTLFVYHEMQYGINERFNLGFGASIAASPVYVLPSFKFKLSEKSHLSAGNLTLFYFIDPFFIGNLLYGTYTYGTIENNLGAGAGLWLMRQTDFENDITSNSLSPAVNLFCHFKLGERTYFISEHYWFYFNTINSARNMTEIPPIFEHFVQKNTTVFGLTGFRFRNKKKTNRSWQIGMFYMLNFRGEVPDQYLHSPWQVDRTEGTVGFLPVPFVSYSVRFRKNYKQK